MNVRMRGLFSWAANYKYSLDKKNLSDYSMEQQAAMVSDYWLLMKFGLVKNKRIINYNDYDLSQSVKDLVMKYQVILKGFPQ